MGPGVLHMACWQALPVLVPAWLGLVGTSHAAGAVGSNSVAAAAEGERRALFVQIADSVVFISCGPGLGSGFFVGGSGLIATNRHVVDCKDKVDVITRSGQKRRATVELQDPVYDLALIRVPASDLVVRPLVLSDSDRVQVGDYAAAVSHPVGAVWTFNEGFVSNRFPDEDDQFGGIIQTQIPLLPGSSGGPVVNRHGQVICVHTAGLRSMATMGFCIGSNLLRRLMAQQAAAVGAHLALNADFLGGETFVDGKGSGPIPALLTLSAGEHTVTVTLADRFLSRRVVLEPGRTTTLFFKKADLAGHPTPGGTK